MADFYWVGGTGNWSEYGTHWATTSGGAVFHGNAPTSADDVYFDANSFSGAGQTVTVDAAAYCKDMDWTGATNSPTLAVNNAIMAYGDVTTIQAMSATGTSSIYVYGSGTRSITTNGLEWGCRLSSDIGFTGTINFNDDFMAERIIIARGTWNTNNNNLTAGFFYIDSASTVVINLGSSTITATGGVNGWWVNNSAGLTLNAGTSVIIDSTGFVGGSQTYYTVNLTGATSTITGDNTFTTLGLTRSDVQTITFTDGTTQTITNLTRDSGVSVKTLAGSGAAGWNLVKSGGTSNVVDLRNMSISYSNASPSQTWYAGIMSTDGGNNTGWNFANAPHRNMWLLRRRK